MKLLLTILLFTLSLVTHATRWDVPGGGQVCWVFDGSGFCSPPGVIQPGDTIVFDASDPPTTFAMIGYWGAEGDSIVLINEGGQVVMDAMSFEHCRYIKVDGLYEEGVEYGFKLRGDGDINFSPGISVSGRSKAFHLQGFWVHEMGYIVMFKEDFSCVDSTNYPNWTMDGCIINNYKGTKIWQDGLYIGNTNPRGDELTCDGTPTQVHPVLLANVRIFNGYIDSCNRTSIQVGLCHTAWIYDNTILRSGYEWNQSQGNGIAIGGASQNVRVYNNTIRYTFLYGIVNFGRGTNYIYNNTVDSVGFLPLPEFTDADSLINVMDSVIALSNGVWDDGFYHMQVNDGMVYNTFSQPCNIKVQPDWNPYGEIEETEAEDSSESHIYSNILGQSMVLNGSYVYIGGISNQIVFDDQSDAGKNPVGYNNYICSNLWIDEETAAADPSTDGKHYFDTGCAASVIRNFFRKRRGARLIFIPL